MAACFSLAASCPSRLAITTVRAHAPTLATAAAISAVRGITCTERACNRGAHTASAAHTDDGERSSILPRLSNLEKNLEFGIGSAHQFVEVCMRVHVRRSWVLLLPSRALAPAVTYRNILTAPRGDMLAKFGRACSTRLQHACSVEGSGVSYLGEVHTMLVLERTMQNAHVRGRRKRYRLLTCSSPTRALRSSRRREALSAPSHVGGPMRECALHSACHVH